jgi:hypothetical protein
MKFTQGRCLSIMLNSRRDGQPFFQHLLQRHIKPAGHIGGIENHPGGVIHRPRTTDADRNYLFIARYITPQFIQATAYPLDHKGGTLRDPGFGVNLFYNLVIWANQTGGNLSGAQIDPNDPTRLMI